MRTITALEPNASAAPTLGHPDYGIPIGTARLPHDTGDPELDRRAVRRKHQIQ